MARPIALPLVVLVSLAVVLSSVPMVEASWPSPFVGVISDCPSAWNARTNIGDDPYLAAVKDTNYVPIAETWTQWVITADYDKPGTLNPQPLPVNGSAYIFSMAMVAMVYNGFVRNFTLAYSHSFWTSATGTWEHETSYTTTGATFPSPYTLVRVNITAFETWTPDLCLNLAVRLKSTDLTDTPLWCDYVGIYIVYAILATDPIDPPDEGTDYSWNGTSLSIMGAFGLIGALGLVACPAFAIHVWRQGGEDRIVRILYAVMAMVMFFALFIGSMAI